YRTNPFPCRLRGGTGTSTAEAALFGPEKTSELHHRITRNKLNYIKEQGIMRFYESQETGVVFTLLEPGDLLLESICEVARQANIHTGVLMTGIGSLSKARIHTIL